MTIRAIGWIVVWAALLASAPLAWAQAPVAAPTVEVTSVRITGHTVFTTDELHRLVAPAEGRRLTLPELHALAARITNHYVAAGYLLARATVPMQDVVDGVVEIRVVEGTIGRIDVRGARRYDPDRLRSYFRLRDVPVFDATAIDRALLLLNDLPGLTVAATSKAGDAPGTTDLVVDVLRERWFSGSLEVDNYGAVSTGRERFGLALNFNNPFGIGDVISLRGLVTLEDLDLERVAYTVPIGRWGTKLEASYTHVNAEAGGAVASLGIVGTGHLATLVATHPFVRDRALTLVGFGGFAYKDLETTILDDSANRDRLRVAFTGLAVDASDAWQGRSTAMLTLHQGIGDFLDGQRGDNDSHASRAGAGGTFTKLTAEASRLQQALVGTSALFLKASGQWVSRRIHASEQFIIGGQGTVRGYPLAEFSGDYGYAVTVELRWNAPGFADRPAFLGRTWGELLQLFVFTDHGGIVVKDAPAGTNRVTDLTGAGVGVRFVIPERLSVAFEYAKPVDGPRPSDGRQDVFYFQVIVPF